MKETAKKSKDVGAVFEVFKIEEKIEELKNILLMEKIDLKNESVIIIVPSYDESQRFIKEDDRVLFDAQLEDAHALAQHLMINMDVNMVSIVVDSLQLNASLRSVVPIYEYVIFLHEFTTFEKNYILEEIKRFSYGYSVRSIELY